MLVIVLCMIVRCLECMLGVMRDVGGYGKGSNLIRGLRV